jgi:hypothetical protein
MASTQAEAAVAEYVNAVLEVGDAELLLMALGDVARARGVKLTAAPPQGSSGPEPRIALHARTIQIVSAASSTR